MNDSELVGAEHILPVDQPIKAATHARRWCLLSAAWARSRFPWLSFSLTFFSGRVLKPFLYAAEYKFSKPEETPSFGGNRQ